MAPITEPSSWISPSPREPSTQVKTNCLPVTNCRAASGLIDCAAAGTVASKLAINNANLEIMFDSPPIPTEAYPR
jgi:hypothetical protein